MRHSTLKKGNIADGTSISLSMIIITSAETFKFILYSRNANKFRIIIKKNAKY